MKIEFVRNELYLVTKENENMEADLQKETVEITEKRREDLTQLLKSKEYELITQLDDAERELINKNHKVMTALRAEEFQYQKTADAEFEAETKKFNQQIKILDDFCRAMKNSNDITHRKIDELNSAECQSCPRWGRRIKKLEKRLVSLQFVERDIQLASMNRSDLFHLFHGSDQEDDAESI
jgi:small-conductance mechanosensitive channel